MLAFAAEKGIELELKPTGDAPGQPGPDFLAASPLRKMPALRDGDFTLAEFERDRHYLEAKQPEPEADPARARSCAAEQSGSRNIADTVLIACGAKMFFNRIVAPLFFKRPGDLDAARQSGAATSFRRSSTISQNVVPDAGGFLVGDRLTLADIAIASPFANLRTLGCAKDSERHGRVYAYVESILVAAELRAVDRTGECDPREGRRLTQKAPRFL